MPGAHKFQRTERGAEPVEDMEMYSDEDLEGGFEDVEDAEDDVCLLYTSPSPRD